MIQRPRGTKDIFGYDEKIYKFIFDTFESLAHSYNLKKIITPTFESLELFRDSSGEDSDIVSKEIYKFTDYSNREFALKPEGTASIGRAIIENKLYSQSQYNKLFYIDSMYRYERPQKGRLRQFYQIGVEFTNELCINSIIDVIVLANSFLKKLDINDFVVNINNIGTVEERKLYVDELRKYLKKHKDELSEKSQQRIETNPLRILDDKNDANLDAIKNAPKICQYWSSETKKEFDEVLQILDSLNINYEINYSLVRGLDYYSNIVFEFISTSEFLGSKTTIIGGGCYLNLMKNDDTTKINGVGFGIGVERIFEILKNSKKCESMENDIDVYFLIENEKQYETIRPIIYSLRLQNISTEYNYKTKKFKKLLVDATKANAKLIIFQQLDQQGTNNWTIKKDKNNNIFNLNELNYKIKDML
ncbi:MAG: histidine--tRNA ligase [Mycoplasma sp.]|nr:histidine--tRNA ligase [Mycoplasma sp.]